MPGSVVNKWLDDIPAWREKHPDYLVWSEFEKRILDPDLIFHDNLCHAFSAWSIQTLYNHGANFGSNQAPLCRNYVPLVGDGVPTRLNPHNPADFRTIAQFYQSFGHVLKEEENANDNGAAFKAWISREQHFVLYSGQNYYYAKLQDPWLASSTAYTMRPMHMTWQNPMVFRYGVCQWRHATDSVFV